MLSMASAYETVSSCDPNHDSLMRDPGWVLSCSVTRGKRRYDYKAPSSVTLDGHSLFLLELWATAEMDIRRRFWAFDTILHGSKDRFYLR
jgi:hypothetical protein